MMTARQLVQQHLSAGCLSPTQLDWLRGQGVSPSAIIEWPIVNSARVLFNDNRFDFATHGDDGQNVLTLLIEDMYRPIDIAAWAPKTGNMGTWLGLGFAVSQSDIFNPGKYAFNGCLRIHKTPLDWLISNRDGIAIIDSAKTYSFLRSASRLSFADVAYGMKVRSWMKPPAPTTEYFFEKSQEAAA